MKESLRQQDYHKVFQKRGDCIRLLAQTSGVVIFFAWFFYRSIWGFSIFAGASTDSVGRTDRN